MATEIHGTCDSRFEPVREAFLANFAAGDEVGATVAVTVNGEFAVDLWGGHTDAARTRPWQEDTIGNVWSCTKAMTALCAHILVDRGQLDVSRPIAGYWPEFAANGKEGILVSHALSHQAGLPDFEGESTFEQTIDWEWTVDNLANATPVWPAGSQLAYHAVTFGTLVGEIVRRITGKSLGTFFRDEVAQPLGADFHIGLPESEHARVAAIIPFDDTNGFDIEVINTPAARSAEIPAGNGHGNAHAMARVMSLLANGGELDGVRLLSREAVEAAITGQVYAMDGTIGRPYHRALGYILMSPELSEPMGLPSAFYDDSESMPRIFGHDGMGGAQVFCDLDRNVAWAYTMNNMTGGEGCNERVARLMQAIAPCIAAG
jgi:CubicO group peptidase (beta-lactamase class C family)